MSVTLDATEYQALKAGFDPVAERSTSLPSRAYRDPQFLSLEQTEIFFRSWQFLCHAEILRQPGNYMAGNIQGRCIFAARDAKNHSRVLQRLPAPRTRAA
ncbi:MAG: hypothetical protein ACRETP_11045 [Steroidobacteraceae bacterium]